jgi:thiamine biosynthesis protein ThiS
LEIIVNGESQDVPNQITIEELISRIGLRSDRLAVERNHEVVSRSQWPSVLLKEGDRLEIIHFVGGGMGVMGDR